MGTPHATSAPSASSSSRSGRSAKPIQLRKEMVYPHSPENVWVALTDPHALAEWLMPNNFKAEVGHRFQFQVDPMPLCNTRTECEVLEVDPPRRLVYTWTLHFDNKPGKKPQGPMTITWTLEPEGEGTRLVLVQEGLETMWWLYRRWMSMGWGGMLKRLMPKVLERVDVGEGGELAFTPGAVPLEKRCYKVKTIPADLVR